MARPTPLLWLQIDGGREVFAEAYGQVADDVARRQLRLIATLDAIEPAGNVAWDPRSGRLTMRRRVFRAQCLGSFDGRTWLWAWANSAALPAEQLTLANGARDAAHRLRIPAFAAPMIEDDDVTTPAMIGGLCCAHGFGDAFVIAGGTQVCALLPGQLDARAWIPSGAPFDRFALAFSRRPRTLVEVLDHLRADDELGGLDLIQYGADLATAEGDGYQLTIRRIADIEELRREVKALHDDGNPARRAVTLFVVETTLAPGYEGATFPFVRPAVWPIGPRAVAAEAVAVAERLNGMAEIAVIDVLRRSWYPLH